MVNRVILLVLTAAVVGFAWTGIATPRHPIGPAEFFWLMNRACSEGDEIGVQMLLKAGADPDGVRDFEAFHKSSYQFGLNPSWPVNQATYAGHVEVVRLLLRAGAKPSAPEDMGQTALAIAASRGNVEIVKALLDAGASRTDRLLDGERLEGTAEEIAAQAGHADVARAIRGYRPGK